MKNITIVGGGLSGWLTALYLKKIQFSQEVVVIESSEIGILGAGEGSVPYLKRMLIDLLEIDESIFIEKTKSTKKAAINFENWSGNGTKFDHDFIGNNRKYNSDGTPDYSKSYAYHFDARLIADFLKSIAIERGVKVIEGEVVDFNLDTDKNITSIVLKDNTVVDTNFVFDCSGFKRLIIGALYNSSWTSYEDQLKVNTAVPFFLARTDNEEFVKTDAIAMGYGWMWKIPLQDRWGCGYVFDNNYITEAEAKEEVKSYLGIDVSFNNTLRFNSGCFQETWVNNCVAIGLSSGFMEPLEATSIMISILQLFAFHEEVLKVGIDRYSEVRDTYNEFIRSLNQECMLFVRHHYVCDKEDTDFWIDYKNLPLPEKLEKYKRNNFDDITMLHYSDKNIKLFNNWSYKLVNNGNFLYSI